MRISALGVGLWVLTLGIPAVAAEKAEPASDESTGSDEASDSAKSAASDESSDTEEAKPAKKKRAKSEAKDEPGEGDKSYGHGGQLGLRLGLVGGYRMIFRYEPSPFCTVPDPNKQDGARGQQKFCGHGAPMALDVAASFTLIRQVEPFLWGRFGFIGEGRTDTQPLILAGVGIRLYTMSDAAFKVFVEPAVAMELDGGMGSRSFEIFPEFRGDYKKDFIFHLAIGPQYDLARGVGIFLDGGLTVGVVRYIQATLELVGGVQVRFP